MDERRKDQEDRTDWVWNPELRDAYAEALAALLSAGFPRPQPRLQPRPEQPISADQRR